MCGTTENGPCGPCSSLGGRMWTSLMWICVPVVLLRGLLKPLRPIIPSAWACWFCCIYPMHQNLLESIWALLHKWLMLVTTECTPLNDNNLVVLGNQPLMTIKLEVTWWLNYQRGTMSNLQSNLLFSRKKIIKREKKSFVPFTIFWLERITFTRTHDPKSLW